MTQQELADRLGVDKQTVWRYENGNADFFKKNARELARVLGVRTPEALLHGGPAKVLLVGKVGAGAEVFPLDDDNEWIEAPPGMGEDGFALQVTGRSMLPVYRPNEILFGQMRANVASDVIGADCFVQVTDGPRLVKRVQPGQAKGHFRLYSYDTQDESDDLRLDWAAPVRWVSR